MSDKKFKQLLKSITRYSDNTTRAGGLVCILLLWLKLTHQVGPELTWSWVVAPLWLPAATLIALVVVVMIACAIFSILRHLGGKVWSRAAGWRSRAKRSRQGLRTVPDRPEGK